MKLSDYIEEDLAARLTAGQDLPESWTLGAIAKRYDVSLTPVRAALDRLIRRKLLVKLPNGRVQPSRPRRHPSKRPPTAPATPRSWDDTVRRELIFLSLTSDEDLFVREEPLAERLGVGRSALRGILQRLAGGGLVEHVPRRGWHLPAFRQSEMEAYLDVRETLELKAFDLARPKLESAQLGEMLRGNGTEAIKANSLDNTLHAYFVECSGNRYLRSFFAVNGRNYNALFDYAALGTKVLAEMAGQHRSILENARARRWSKARSSLSEHIRSQQPILTKMVAIARSEAGPTYLNGHHDELP